MRHQYHPLGFEGSRIAQGFMRADTWGMTAQERLAFIEQCLLAGVTTFDHADVYGNYQCESLFGEALLLAPSLRDKLQIVAKCGVRQPSINRPDIAYHSYDLSFKYIVASVEQSLINLNTDYLDALLIHRPSPLMDADEVARAFEHLQIQGKVSYFGVANFSAHQFDNLQSRLDVPLIINQVELSVLALGALQDGRLDHVQQHAVTPMAWSPLAGGRLFYDQDDLTRRVRRVMTEMVATMEGVTLTQLALAWLLRYPAAICPVIGSGDIERVMASVAATNIKLTDDQWFAIWCAATGAPVTI